MNKRYCRTISEKRVHTIRNWNPRIFIDECVCCHRRRRAFPINVTKEDFWLLYRTYRKLFFSFFFFINIIHTPVDKKSFFVPFIGSGRRWKHITRNSRISIAWALLRRLHAFIIALCVVHVSIYLCIYTSTWLVYKYQN